MFVFMFGISYAGQTLMELQFSQQNFEKYSNLNPMIIHQPEPCCVMQTGGGMDGWTDRETYDEVNSLFRSSATRLITGFPLLL
jgi:hypothetical protein